MNRIITSLAFLAMAMIAVGCADDGQPQKMPEAVPLPTPLPESKPGTSVKETYLVNGEEPAEFFKSFRFGTVGSCVNQSLWYKKVSSKRIMLGKDEVGRDIIGNLEVMILDDGTYYALYQEVSVIRYTRYGYDSTSGQKKEIHGHWRIFRDKLELDSLGFASGLMYNDRKAMNLVFYRDLFTSGLVGTSTLLKTVLSNNAGVSELEVCKR